MSKCPKCGYCPSCGRADDKPQAPYRYPWGKYPPNAPTAPTMPYVYPSIDNDNTQPAPLVVWYN